MAIRRQSQASVRILEILFFQGSVEAAAARALEGGLTVAPSAPGLADDLRNLHYARALRSADLVVPDSGYMVLLWWLLRGEWMERVSGLSLMDALLRDHASSLGESGFWVMPSAADAEALKRHLDERSIELPAKGVYIAPVYQLSNLEDHDLLARLEATRPAVVIVGIAGGKQEILGAWLRDNLSYRPAIICIGAAIAFITGQQTHIPKWADRLFLGWLFRLVAQPYRYMGRYLRAVRLAWALAR